MISENIIKTKFIVYTMNRGAKIYYLRESEQFDKYLKSKTGSTKKALSNPDYKIGAMGEQFQISGKITKQLRFEDFGLRQLYTVPFHSVFYRMYYQLHYGLRNEIREQIISELEPALNPQSNGKEIN